MSNTFRKHLPTIVGLTIALGSSILWRIAGLPPSGLDLTQRSLVNVAFKWMITTVLLMLILLWERQPLSSIGIRKTTARDAFWGFIGFLAGGAIISVTMPIVSALGLSTTESGVRRLAELSIGLRVIIVLTAGITEEIQYRGYVIERLTGRLGLSAAISWILFVLLHIWFWGLGGALQIGLASVVLYALYFWRRDLLACILMHVLNDAVALLLIPIILERVS